MSKHTVDVFLDSEGRIFIWPSKKIAKIMLLEYLATKFEKNRTYNETEVNEILKKWHTFSDWSLLRREMYNNRIFDRKRDGSEYKLSEDIERKTSKSYGL